MYRLQQQMEDILESMSQIDHDDLCKMAIELFCEHITTYGK